MTATITSPVPVTEDSSIAAIAADLRRRSKTLAEYMAKLAEMYQAAADEQAEIDEQSAAIEQYIDELEASVKYRDESHRSRRRHKKADRLRVCQHRSNGLASLSDSTHIKLTTKARRKAERDRESDKPTSQIRRARLRKQEERTEMTRVLFHLTPVEIEFFAKKAEARKASKEGKRVKLLATLTDASQISVLLNGDLHS